VAATHGCGSAAGPAVAAATGVAGNGAAMAPAGPRVHPLLRAAAAGRGVAGRGLDEVDALLGDVVPVPVPRPPWLAAYAALTNRVTRHFGWRLLHGALRCGAASVYWCDAGSEPALWAAVCCPNPGCAEAAGLPGGRLLAPALADYSHTFLHCPAVRPAVRWLCDMWARIAPEDTPVPHDVRVLLLGDATVWSPAGGEVMSSLWLHLRLLWCRAVWVQASAGSPGVPLDWRAVVAMVRAWLARTGPDRVAQGSTGMHRNAQGCT
jgi:hypothetical protein